MLVGLIHAFLINELRIAPFIVTLASLVILRGIGLSISSSPVGKASREFLMFYVQKIGPVPIIALIFVVLLILAALLLRYTVFGKHLFAIGGNTEVAHLSGVPVKRVRYGVYVISSITASITGLLWLSRMGVGDPAMVMASNCRRSLPSSSVVRVCLVAGPAFWAPWAAYCSWA